MLKTWRQLISDEMKNRGESFDTPHDFICGPVEKWTEDGVEEIPGSLDQEFYPGYGGSEGCPFTLWTPNYVYFPVVYDGAEWVGSVPRNPAPEATRHFGGQ